jgi:hypothetical protein
VTGREGRIFREAAEPSPALWQREAEPEKGGGIYFFMLLGGQSHPIEKFKIRYYTLNS